MAKRTLQHTRRARRIVVALAISLLAPLGVLVQPAHAAGTGTLAGVVRDPSGTGIGGLTVQALNATWGFPVSSTTTNPDGSYGFPVLGIGNYRVRVHDPTGTWPDRYSGNSPTWAASQAVALSTNATTTVDITYPEPATIQGTVTGATNPLGGILVELLREDGWAVATQTTGLDGAYQFSDLFGGPYTLSYSDPAGTWATQFNGPSNSRFGAPRISVTGGSTHTIDVSLNAAAHLTGNIAIGEHPNPRSLEVGTFSSATYASPEGVVAVVLDAPSAEIIALGFTDADGNFDVGHLGPGDHKLGFVHPATFGANPETGYRPTFTGGHDIYAESLAGAFFAAPTYTLPVGGSVETGTERLTGWDCDPTVYFPGANLTGADLTGKRLAGCPLAGANLTNADATDANLTLADLEGADLRGADLLTTILNGADLRSADLRDQTLVELSGGSAISSAVSWKHTLLQGALIEHADFSGAYVGSIDLCVAYPDWTGLRTTGAHEPTWEWMFGWKPGMALFEYGIAQPGIPLPDTFAVSPAAIEERCQVPGTTADLSDFSFPGSATGGWDWRNRDLHGLGCRLCTFPSPADFSGSDLTDAVLPVRFDDAKLTATNLTRADLRGAALARAAMAGATLTDTDLYSADLRNATGLTGAQLLAAEPDWTELLLAGTGVDLNGADLTGHALLRVDFSGVNLTSADLSDTDLRDSRHVGTNFTNADLSGANLANADLTGANLTGANLTGANLAGAKFAGVTGLTLQQLLAAMGTLAGMDLRSFDFGGSDLSGLNLTGSNLSGVNLAGADLDGANLTNANLTGATLTGASMVGTTVRGTSFLNAIGLATPQITATNHDWTATDLRGTALNLTGTNFSGYLLQSIRLDGLDLTSASFTTTILSLATFTGANLTGANLTAAHIYGADFTNAVGLTRTQLLAAGKDWTNLDLDGTGVDLSGVDFTDSSYQLSGIDLSGLDVSGANLTGKWLGAARLIGTDLSGANLTGSTGARDFTGADLTNANLTNANLSGNNLTNANLAGATLTGVAFSNQTSITGASFASTTGLSFTQLNKTTNWTGVNLSAPSVALTGTNLSAKTLVGINLTNQDLTGANLSGRDLAGATLSGATIAGANLYLTKNVTPAMLAATAPNWANTTLRGAKLTGLSLVGRTMTATNLQSASMTDVDLTGVDLSGANLSGAGLQGATLTGASLTAATVSSANLTGAVGLTTPQLLATLPDWSSIQLGGTGVDLSGVDFAATGHVLNFANLSALSLVGADLTGRSLIGTVLAGANLTSANLSGANLTSANLSGANLSLANLLGITGSPTGGATATYATTTCPDGVVTDGVVVTSCVGHGLAA